MHHLHAKEIYLLERRTEFLKELSWITDQDDFQQFDLETQEKIDKLSDRYKDVSLPSQFAKEIRTIHDELYNRCNNEDLVETPLDT